MFARGRCPGQHRPMRGSLTVAVILFVASVHPAAATHVFHAAWRWNSASHRFDPAASTLDGLEALNKQLFE